MKKIKKFKINLRLRDTVRNLKKTAAVSDITPELEEAVKRESRRVESVISAAAVYETLSKEKIDFDLGVEPPEKWVAASLFVATIGKDVEEELLKANALQDNLIGQILHAVFLEALDQSVNFIARLLADEAKDDNCELSPRKTATSGAVAEKIIISLPSDKIGVKYAGNESFDPRYTVCGVIFWSPLKKRGRR